MSFFFRDTHGRRWDFDIMLDKKKLDRRRRRRRDGSIDLMADADDQIRELIDAMNEAANVLIFFKLNL